MDFCPLGDNFMSVFLGLFACHEKYFVAGYEAIKLNRPLYLVLLLDIIKLWGIFIIFYQILGSLIFIEKLNHINFGRAIFSS